MTEGQVKREIDKRLHKLAISMGTPIHIFPMSDKYNVGVADRMVMTPGRVFFYEGKRDSSRYTFTLEQRSKAMVLYKDLGIKTYGFESKDGRAFKVYYDLESDPIEFNSKEFTEALKSILQEAMNGKVCKG